MTKTASSNNAKKKDGAFGVGDGGHAIKKTKRVDNKKKQKAVVEKYIINNKASEVFVAGDDVEVSWSGHVYTGRVLEKGSAGYLIHYKGWKQTFDDWVDQVKDAPEEPAALEVVDQVKATPKATKYFSIFEKKSATDHATPETPKHFSIFEKKVPTALQMMNNSTPNNKNNSTPNSKNISTPNRKNNSTPNSKKSSFTKVIHSQRKIIIQNDDIENLSEYEKIRLANIKEREEMFARLSISEAKNELRQVLTPISANKLAAFNRGIKSEKNVKDEILTPRRQSKRILGLSWKTDEEKMEANPEPVDEYPRLRLENIHCQETYRGQPEISQSFLSTILSKGSSVENVDLLTRSLDNLAINENRVAKVVEQRIFSLAVHPGSGKLLVAAGGKAGGVGLWDVEDLDSKTQGVHLYVPHSRPVNCLNWNKFNEKQLVSTSYDGTVGALDVEKQEHILLYADQEDNYTSLHCQTGPNTLLVSVSNGEIVLVDARVDNLAPVQRYGVFERLVSKSLDVHPLDQNYFLCCNNKGFCGVFDARGGGGAGKMMTPVCKLSGHTRGLSSAMFSPLLGGKIATLSYDDHLRLYNSSSMSGEILPSTSVKHNNHTGRWLTPLKLQWRPGHEDLLLTGSMQKPRQMEVWRVEGEAMVMEKALRGEVLASVCSVVAMHPVYNVVVGGNSSGRVHVFM